MSTQPRGDGDRVHVADGAATQGVTGRWYATATRQPARTPPCASTPIQRRTRPSCVVALLS